MKWLDRYKHFQLADEQSVFDYFISTMRPGVADWGYFVAWDKVFANTRDIETTLHTMNYLLGKDNFDAEFKYLVRQYPAVLRMIPILNVRDSEKSTTLSVVTVNGTVLTEENFAFNLADPSEQDLDNALVFIRNSGLIRIFQKDGVKNLVDYVLGVEAGLSSNGRKNRGGDAMENVCGALLKSLKCDYIREATPEEIKRKFNVSLKNVDGRRFDFVLMSPNGLTIVEANCYTSKGSKLDKTASDFRTLQDDLHGQATFIWLTDGKGWRHTLNPLRKAFDHNDYILNIHMVENGFFEDILGLGRIGKI